MREEKDSKIILFTMKADESFQEILTAIAKKHDRSRSAVVRILVKEEAKKLGILKD